MRDYDGGMPATAVAFNALSGDMLLVKGRYRLLGWTIFNTATSQGVVRIRDGEDRNSNVVAPLLIAASSDSVQWIGDRGVELTIGAFLAIDAGVLTGALYVVPMWYPLME